MRVVIDLRWMRPGLAGGIENLSRSFLDELMGLDRVNTYRVLVPAEVSCDFDLRQHRNFSFEAHDGPARLGRGVLQRLRRWVGTAGREPAPDVVVSLAGYIAPDHFLARNVLVFVDLQHEFHPEFFSPETLEERRRVCAASLARAARVIAISEHARQSAIERCGFPPERIATAHLAADPLFEPANRVAGDRERVRAKYGLPPGEYLLFPAHTWPHKNHTGAAEALAHLRTLGLRPLLVLTGGAREGEAAFAAAVERWGLGGQVKRLGYCPHEDMPALYEDAAALFYPSFFEGFGIPVVEAMWSGCPVVCSRTTSLPEIAGDAALLCDPGVPAEMAAALARVLGDASLRARLAQAGRRQARRFSWRRFTLAVLRAVQEVQVAH